MSPAKSTLTPQRKHRKLLKDGSGSEVWPESVEHVFVEGLKAYWNSPWASCSGGRSRWRNQFLVEYLQQKGIERSKKQVASHLQVLRNMWKGEPEYHLVAGADEAILDHTNNSPSSSSSSSLPGSSSLPSSPPTSVHSSPIPTDYLSLSNASPLRATCITLQASQMTPFHIKIDGLLPPTCPTPPPAVIKLRLSVPPPTSSGLFQGFTGSVGITSFTGRVKCTTKVYVDGRKVLEEMDEMRVVKSEDQDVSEVILPMSNLTTCRWFDPAKRTSLTQEISLIPVDVQNQKVQPLLYIMYELDRNADFPEAKVVRYDRYHTSSSSTTTRSPPATYNPGSPPASQYHIVNVNGSSTSTPWSGSLFQLSSTSSSSSGESGEGVPAPSPLLGMASLNPNSQSPFSNSSHFPHTLPHTRIHPQAHTELYHHQQMQPTLSTYNYS
ncbi:hypothetical protein E1B28_008783 [Marasmius oreades]|uniref:TEA domain-containing protein n=1 Tax=Marasmius oreades TaxID=181124 RepID=A0A9P7RZ85_9AGAR|nr:uncharacterized protein E1B28_008783 [Marasmius oreades]KAG7092427.1 hypothetical protein E1B28_008783 [Marasmius oreades]